MRRTLQAALVAAAVSASMATGAAHANGTDPVFEPVRTQAQAAPKPSKESKASKPSKARKPGVSANKEAPSCSDSLARTLKEAGFRGDDLKEAWAISMRESGGRAKAVSPTGDYGLFQFNKAAHGSQSWWKERKLLRAGYNAKVAYRMSQGGKTWYPWGLNGKGKVKATLYRNLGWSKARIKSDIVRPYRKYLRAFPQHCY